MPSYSVLTTSGGQRVDALNVRARRSELNKNVYLNFSVRNISDGALRDLQLDPKIRNFKASEKKKGVYNFGIRWEDAPGFGIKTDENLVKIFKQANSEIEKYEKWKASKDSNDPDDLPF